MTTYTAEQVRTALPYTVRQYAGTVTDAVNRRGADRDTLEQVVRTIGGDPSNYQREITEFLANLTASRTITEAAQTPADRAWELELAESEAFNEFRGDAADTLRRIGQENGLRSSIVEQALVTAGLVDPEPEPESVSNDGEAPAWAQAIMDRLDRMTEFARQHGFRG